MEITIRSDSIIIDGYVNAVERYSKVLQDKKGKFIEKINAGAFARALQRAKKTGYNVKVLHNHDYSKELTNTGEKSTKIREDSIGLRCTCTIRDTEVIQKAKEGKLTGWSFGFIPIRETRKPDDNEDGIQKREIRELELKEVSILDNKKIPAYNGTSVECRAEITEELIEIRIQNDQITRMKKKKKMRTITNN